MRLGQNFLADTNLLEAIVREAGVGEVDVVLEVGPGAGVLTERLAPRSPRTFTRWSWTAGWSRSWANWPRAPM